MFHEEFTGDVKSLSEFFCSRGLNKAGVCSEFVSFVSILLPAEELSRAGVGHPRAIKKIAPLFRLFAR